MHLRSQFSISHIYLDFNIFLHRGATLERKYDIYLYFYATKYYYSYIRCFEQSFSKISIRDSGIGNRLFSFLSPLVGINIGYAV